MAERPCMNSCGPYYEVDSDFCGLPEGHDGDCDPTYRPALPAFLREGEENDWGGDAPEWTLNRQ